MTVNDNVVLPLPTGQIKKVGDVEVGVITQCVQARTVKMCKIPVISQFLLKINAKMGGINNIIANPSTPPVCWKHCLSLQIVLLHV